MKNWRVIGVFAAVLLGLAVAGGYLYGSHKTRNEPSYLVGDRYRVVRTPGGLLEVATLQKQESFAWQTSWTCLANLCGSLPSSSSQISADVHYTYRIPLAAHWVLEKVSNDPLQYRLQVPKLEPKLPVAVSLPSIRITNSGSVFSPSGPTQQRMQTYMEPLLESRAKSAEYLRVQEANARKTVEEFARKWMRDGESKIPSTATIEVVFSQ